MRPLLGTFVEITAQGLPAPPLGEAVSDAFTVIERAQRKLSFFDPSSDVSILNHRAFNTPVRVSPWCYAVLKAAYRVSEHTEGLFDCTIDSGGTYRDIVFLPGKRIRFKRRLTVDLGGIAKGFAVDLAVRELKKKDVPSGCVNAGGDLRLFGKQSRPVYVRHPRNPSTLMFLGHFQETALATSGTYFGGKIVSLVLRKRHEKKSSVTVIAPRCMIADALTKPALLNPEQSNSLLKKFGAQGFFMEDRQ